MDKIKSGRMPEKPTRAESQDIEKFGIWPETINAAFLTTADLIRQAPESAELGPRIAQGESLSPETRKLIEEGLGPDYKAYDVFDYVKKEDPLSGMSALHRMAAISGLMYFIWKY